jgi:hypothetical protein
MKSHAVRNSKRNATKSVLPVKGVITQGNVDDREPLSPDRFIKNVSGKLYGDRGYISQRLAEILFVDGIHPVYRLRNNMKGGEIPLTDRIMPGKRAICLYF